VWTAARGDSAAYVSYVQLSSIADVQQFDVEANVARPAGRAGERAAGAMLLTPLRRCIMHHATATSSAAPTAKPNPALERLNSEVRELLDSQVWQEALKFKARFHPYSFNNALLIYLQRPDATLVAGYRRWQELGRQVRKGEQSLAILAPIVRRFEDETEGERVQQVVGFRSARVFDVSQTDGESIPEPPHPVLLEDDGEAIRAALEKVEAFSISKGFPVSYENLREGALGSFSLTKWAIKLRGDLPPLQTLKTLVHELAHGLMHADPKIGEKRHLIELEAESCAFLVLHDLGLDTARYTFPYLAHWTEHPDELLVAGEKAAKVAEEVLNALRPSSEPAEEN